MVVTMGLVLLFLAAGFDSAEAVLPTGELRLADGSTAYAAPAWFGLQLPEEKEATYLPLRVPKSDADGCGKVTVEDPPEGGGGFVLLVERGNCFFDAKALAAQEAGAEGLVVMNSVEGIYQVRQGKVGCTAVRGGCVLLAKRALSDWQHMMNLTYISDQLVVCILLSMGRRCGVPCEGASPRHSETQQQ